MFVENLCSPAVLYLGFALTQIVIDLFRKMYNTAIVKTAVAVVFTTVLNMLCARGLSVISWFIVFIPFVTMTLVTGILLYVFGLAPFTGKLSYSQQNAASAIPKNPAVDRGLGPKQPTHAPAPIPAPAPAAAAPIPAPTPAPQAASTPTETSATTSGEQAIRNADIQARLGGIIGGLTQGVGDVVGGIGQGLSDVSSGVGKGLQGSTSNIGNGLGTMVGGVGQGVSSVIGGLGRGLSDVSSGLGVAFS